LHEEFGYNDKIGVWDIPFYSRIFTERTCQFDKEQLKQYFPVSTVVSGALTIYQNLLGFKFTKVEDYNNTFWHESVELYKVTNMDDSMAGYFYLDLYPREGKYSHAACFPFINKSATTLPVATMACNFNKDNLSFDEVETFFHEFGHVMHHISSEATISMMASFSCEGDFVETPSQMFEEWCYHYDTLKLMSNNLPIELVAKLNQSRQTLQGYFYARQLSFGIFDMKIHSKEFIESNLSPGELFAQVTKEILELEVIPKTCEPASFGHLMGGYDAGYYGYAWSLVYAKDMFSLFTPDNLLNQQFGMKLRKEVLSKGSMRRSIDSVKIFLGRDPSSDMFIKSLQSKDY
jgi:thimet oligopeptidase